MLTAKRRGKTELVEQTTVFYVFVEADTDLFLVEVFFAGFPATPANLATLATLAIPSCCVRRLTGIRVGGTVGNMFPPVMVTAASRRLTIEGLKIRTSAGSFRINNFSPQYEKSVVMS